MVEVAKRYRIRRDVHKVKVKKNPRPPKWAATNMRWPAALWDLSTPLLRPSAETDKEGLASGSVGVIGDG